MYTDPPKDVKEYLLRIKVENVLGNLFAAPKGTYKTATGGKTTAGAGKFRILTMKTSHGTYKAWVEGEGCKDVWAEWRPNENGEGPDAEEIMSALKSAAKIKP